MSPLLPPTGSFPSTQWSLVLRARDRDGDQARQALADLCGRYWYPLYAFIRRQVERPDLALDLTQGFFARLLEKDVLDEVDRRKGKFRSFLLTCCRHFLSNERDRERTQKRGGGREFVPLDGVEADRKYHLEPSHELTAERLFERRWALTLLEETLGLLAGEYEREGKRELYRRLEPMLVQSADARPYATVSTELGMSEAAVKKAAQRMRQRYREILRERIAATVEGPEQIDEEIRLLFAALSP